MVLGNRPGEHETLLVLRLKYRRVEYDLALIAFHKGLHTGDNMMCPQALFAKNV